MSLARMVKSIKRADQLLVTPTIEEWLREQPEGVVWDADGLALWKSLVAKSEANSARSGRFGASSRGTCLRRQMFTFLGMPELRLVDPEVLMLFADGKFRHLRWQMMGLQSGVFTHAEYPARLKKYRLKVSLDALNAPGKWLVEVKGDRNWSRALDGVPEAHLLQIHTMFLATGWDTGVYIIESKSSQEWREIIVRRDPALIRRVEQELEVLNEHVEHRTLPSVLPACARKEGPYRQCPFAKQCLQRHATGDYWPTIPGDWDS